MSAAAWMGAEWYPFDRSCELWYNHNLCVSAPVALSFPSKIGGFVLQRLLTLAMLLICVLWIVVSYLPGVQAYLPVIGFAQGAPWLGALAVPAVLVFLAIQLWLLYSTVSTVRAYQAKSPRSPIQLKLGAELFWTALPIAITIALVWASYARWWNFARP
jgi:hypothetical protein